MHMEHGLNMKLAQEHVGLVVLEQEDDFVNNHLEFEQASIRFVAIWDLILRQFHVNHYRLATNLPAGLHGQLVQHHVEDAEHKVEQENAEQMVNQHTFNHHLAMLKLRNLEIVLTILAINMDAGVYGPNVEQLVDLEQERGAVFVMPMMSKLKLDSALVKDSPLSQKAATYNHAILFPNGPFGQHVLGHVGLEPELRQESVAKMENQLRTELNVVFAI